MKIRLIDDLGQLAAAGTELASCTLPANTTAVLSALYGDSLPSLTVGLLGALNELVAQAVATNPPSDVQAAQAAAQAAAAALVTTGAAYNATIDGIAD